MASTLKYVRVPPNSANMEEARKRVFDFFKTACRSIPSIMQIYVLDEVVKPQELRSTVASEIRKNAHINDPKVIDMLLIKATEELSNIVQHAKQRHHIIGQYVVGNQGLTHDLGMMDQGNSKFLKNFYSSNYF